MGKNLQEEIFKMNIKIEKIKAGDILIIKLSENAYVPSKALEDGVVISEGNMRSKIFLKNSDLHEILNNTLTTFEIDPWIVK
jgi:hypothetical protein